MKRSVTFRTEFDLKRGADIVGITQSELIHFLLTTNYSYYEFVLFANAIKMLSECESLETSHYASWFEFRGRTYDLGFIPYKLWVECPLVGVSRLKNIMDKITIILNTRYIKEMED